VWVPAVCYLAATALFIPGILGSHLTPALWFDIAGAALLAAANPPLDAARLDIVPAGPVGAGLRAREPSVRSLAQALAPVLFGLLADALARHLRHLFAAGADRDPSPACDLEQQRHGPRVQLPDHARHAGRRRIVHGPRPPTHTPATSPPPLRSQATGRAEARPT